MTVYGRKEYHMGSRPLPFASEKSEAHRVKRLIKTAQLWMKVAESKFQPRSSDSKIFPASKKGRCYRFCINYQWDSLVIAPSRIFFQIMTRHAPRSANSPPNLEPPDAFQALPAAVSPVPPATGLITCHLSIHLHRWQLLKSNRTGGAERVAVTTSVVWRFC